MTRKPCPGCGEVVPSRKAAEVCWQCKRDLELAAKTKQLKPAGKERVLLPTWFALHRGYIVDDRLGSIDLDKCILEVLRRAGEEVPLARDKYSYVTDSAGEPLIPPQPERSNSGIVSAVILGEGTIGAVRDLIRKMEVALDAAYREGLRDGRSIIRRLLKGEYDQLCRP